MSMSIPWTKIGIITFNLLAAPRAVGEITAKEFKYKSGNSPLEWWQELLQSLSIGSSLNMLKMP